MSDPTLDDCGVAIVRCDQCNRRMPEGTEPRGRDDLLCAQCLAEWQDPSDEDEREPVGREE